jgi:hypothetical protein
MRDQFATAHSGLVIVRVTGEFTLQVIGLAFTQAYGVLLEGALNAHAEGFGAPGGGGEFRCGNKNARNVYRVSKAHPEGEHIACAVSEADGMLFVEALNTMVGSSAGSADPCAVSS